MGGGGAASYPFGDPVSLSASHLDQLRARKYYAADKSDGVRACCVLAGSAVGYHAVLLGRRGQAKGLAAAADAALFRGTVLDGELVQAGAAGWRYVVFDVAVLGGSSMVASLTLSGRLAAVGAALAAADLQWEGGIQVCVKPMFPLPERADQLQAWLAGLPYASDGVILTPWQDGAPLPGTAHAVFKVKQCHTLDFYWHDGQLWFGSEQEMFPAARLGMVFDPAQLRGVPNGSIVEMAPDAGGGGGGSSLRLHYYQPRPDKRTPNAFGTVQGTLQSIADGLTLERVLHEIQGTP